MLNIKLNSTPRAQRQILTLLFVSFLFLSRAQKFNDFSVCLHEESVNKLFDAIGEISGTNDYEVLLIKGKYHWKALNPRINLKPDSSDFTCDARVEVGPFGYKSKVIGNVKISYDSKKNEISIKITRAIFELYTMILGNKVHIKDIHLEDHFKEPFIFEGPKTITSEMEFTMPDSTKKKIFVQPTDCEMYVKLHEICTYCEISATNKPGRQTIKLQAPIQSADKPKETGIQPQKK